MKKQQNTNTQPNTTKRKPFFTDSLEIYNTPVYAVRTVLTALNSGDKIIKDMLQTLPIDLHAMRGASIAQAIADEHRKAHAELRNEAQTLDRMARRISTTDAERDELTAMRDTLRTMATDRREAAEDVDKDMIHAYSTAMDLIQIAAAEWLLTKDYGLTCKAIRQYIYKNIAPRTYTSVKTYKEVIKEDSPRAEAIKAELDRTCGAKYIPFTAFKVNGRAADGYHEITFDEKKHSYIYKTIYKITYRAESYDMSAPRIRYSDNQTDNDTAEEMTYITAPNNSESTIDSMTDVKRIAQRAKLNEREREFVRLILIDKHIKAIGRAAYEATQKDIQRRADEAREMQKYSYAAELERRRDVTAERQRLKMEKSAALKVMGFKPDAARQFLHRLGKKFKK